MLRRAASIAIASTFLLAACARGIPPETSQDNTQPAAATPPTTSPRSSSAPAVPGLTVAPAEGEPKTGGQVVVGDIADVKTLNPILVNDPASEMVTSRIYASLLSVDPKTGEPRPNLAQKFD
ncbi:MAG: hypothetical protein JOZ87_05575, partial [Chloroflexi bacterium]|nr:hypothetical protein [Chloroflexota bacterium]